MTVSVGTTDVAERFRVAMRHLAATVTILSTENDGARYGMTATAVTSLSISPPAALAAVNQSSLFHAQVSRRGAFCINLLSAHHDGECHAFAGGKPAESRFVDACWAAGPSSLPYFVDAEASIFCTLEQAVDYGTHTIFIGLVQDVRANEAVNPLIYLNGGFVERRLPA